MPRRQAFWSRWLTRWELRILSIMSPAALSMFPSLSFLKATRLVSSTRLMRVSGTTSLQQSISLLMCTSLAQSRPPPCSQQCSDVVICRGHGLPLLCPRTTANTPVARRPEKFDGAAPENYASTVRTAGRADACGVEMGTEARGWGRIVGSLHTEWSRAVGREPVCRRSLQQGWIWVKSDEGKSPIGV